MTTDLSTCHELVSHLFRLPQSQQDCEPYRLTDEQVRFYHAHGYLAGVRILTDEQMRQVRAVIFA